MMRANRLRELLNQGKPTLGTHVTVPWPRMVEVIGHTGAFDYIEYIGEYSTFTLEQFENFGRAIELFPSMSSMIKVEEQTRGFIAQRAVDAGIQNVLFSDCRDAAEVRECIRYVRPETPEAGGSHGAGARRIALGSNAVEWVEAMNNVVIAVMIEKRTAMENLEEILSVKGVDMVQFGPNDYSITLGKPGQGGSPEVQKAQQDMIKRALEMGVAPRVEIATFEQAEPFIDMGVRHFCVGWDTYVISAWCEKQAEGMRKLLA
jgi:2-keto-3-deoxy-L-rhamnonate aldolase RhmA